MLTQHTNSKMMSTNKQSTLLLNEDLQLTYAYSEI